MALLATAAVQEPAHAAPYLQLANSLFAVQPYDARLVALVDAEVRRTPSDDGETITKLIGGTTVQVTARVAGAGWYRVALESGDAGFVREHVLRNADDNTATGEQVAALPRSEPVEVFQDCPACPKMVRLPAGSYVMGSNFDDLTEAPAHSVTLGEPYALGQHEVTVAEWMQCTAAGACTYSPKEITEPARTPVRNISWDDAQEYVRWLSQLTGKPYRLPSEAEWEYAARSGSTTKYWWGNEMAAGLADCEGCSEQWQKDEPAPVTAHKANPFGLHGMAGGVAEWTADCWSRSHKDAPGDGSVRERPGCKKRVLRGGSWRDAAAEARSSARQPHEANLPNVRHGLRVALSLK